MTPGQPQPEPLPITKECDICHTSIEFPVPMPDILNGRKSSSIVFAHENYPTCPQCKTPYLFVITGVGEGRISFIFAPIKLQKPQGGILGATDADLKNAVSNARQMNEIMQRLKGPKQ